MRGERRKEKGEVRGEKRESIGHGAMGGWRGWIHVHCTGYSIQHTGRISTAFRVPFSADPISRCQPALATLPDVLHHIRHLCPFVMQTRMRMAHIKRGAKGV